VQIEVDFSAIVINPKNSMASLATYTVFGIQIHYLSLSIA
jgi:hypothetical protein